MPLELDDYHRSSTLWFTESRVAAARAQGVYICVTRAFRGRHSRMAANSKP
ncbi:hypothetical protein RSAG8_01147, partial [Rhizoctonia solani AG-8 WAC10335]